MAVELAARYVGINQIVEADLTGCDGSLSRTERGSYIATLRAGQGLARKRFTLAHEIGHAIVFRSIGPQAGPSDELHLQCRSKTADQRDEERLCDVLATELIMPRTQFLRAMNEIGVCASTVSVMARKFAVSLQAASRRITQLLPYEIGISQWVIAENSTAFVPKWYVTKRGATTIDYAILVGQPGSECFGDSAVRGWQWVPLQGHMEKYFVDISPVPGPRRAWLAIMVFSDAPQQVMFAISKARQQSSTAGQLPLIDE